MCAGGIVFQWNLSKINVSDFRIKNADILRNCKYFMKLQLLEKNLLIFNEAPTKIDLALKEKEC